MALITFVLTVVVLTFSISCGTEAAKTGLASKVEAVTSYGKQDPNLCYTQGCARAAIDVLGAMNQSADPCEDFYEYVCGGWLKANPLPPDRASVSAFWTIDETNKEALEKDLTTEDATDRPAIKKLKKFYRSCMDEAAIDELGGSPALDLIHTELRGMPLLGDRFVEKYFNLEAYLGRTKNFIMDAFRTTSAPLISLTVQLDAKNSKKNIIALDQPLLGMASRDFFLKPEHNSTLAAYRQYMEDYLRKLWMAKQPTTSYYGHPGKVKKAQGVFEENLKKGVDEIIALETDLAGILQSKVDRLDINKLYKKFTLKEMRKNVSSKFDWYRFVKRAMGKYGITSVRPNTEVVSYGTPYFSKLMPVLEKYDNRVIKNYLVWMDLHRMLPYLSKKFRDTEAKYREATRGTTEEQKRSKVCLDKAERLFLMPLGALFVKKHFPQSSKDEMIEMTANVLKVFKDALYKIKWMDTSTKEQALVKVDAMESLLGYPDYIGDTDNPKLDNEYEKADVTEEKFFESGLSLYRRLTDENLNRLNKPVDRKEWAISPATVNAYYSASQNLIAFPAGILQDPFFQLSRPVAMNYGAIGHVIAHELTHGFDTRGSGFDAEGNLLNWWTDSSKKDFEEKAQCLRDQYSRFYYDTAEMFVNGNLTIGENIADVGGMRYAFEAYQLWKENNGNEKIPFGLAKFTPEQLFFIGNGRSWCYAVRKAEAQRLMLIDYHSPPKFRVDGAMLNLEDFGKAFGCKLGDRMFPKPEDTCRVW